jgi:dienelactone hydrolase
VDFAARLAEYTVERFQDDSGGICIAADVYRQPGRLGAPVVLIHEAPGLSASTLDLADMLHERGFAAVLPSFLMPPSDRPSRMRTIGGMARMCIASEFGALARGGSTPVAGWLRALARKEATAAGQAAGVIGMCFSGGFALGTAVEPQVAAAVMSQPALPFLYGDDLGMPDKDLRRLHAQVGTGGCLRVLRYERDRISRRARFDRLVSEFPDISHVEIPTSDRSKHSVLRDGLTAPAGSDVRIALEETLDFLAARLAPAERP